MSPPVVRVLPMLHDIDPYDFIKFFSSLPPPVNMALVGWLVLCLGLPPLSLTSPGRFLRILTGSAQK